MYECSTRFSYIKETLGSKALISAKNSRNIYTQKGNFNNKVKENKRGDGVRSQP